MNIFPGWGTVMIAVFLLGYLIFILCAVSLPGRIEQSSYCNKKTNALMGNGFRVVACLLAQWLSCVGSSIPCLFVMLAQQPSCNHAQSVTCLDGQIRVSARNKEFSRPSFYQHLSEQQTKIPLDGCLSEK
jgi:hypothetical protein